jgi:uncharacterized protein YPO0396
VICYKISNNGLDVRHWPKQQNNARKKPYDYIYFARFRKLYGVSENGALNTTKVRVGTQQKVTGSRGKNYEA